MSYCFNYCENRNTNYEIPPTETRWLLIPCGGVKESIYPNGSKYGIGSFSVEYSKPFKTLLRYGAAFDCMYDGSTFVHFREDSIPYRSKLKALKIGIAGVGEMSLDRFSLFVNLGVYLYNHDKQIDFLYQRIGLRYRISRSLYTQISLKTHLNISDYIEYGILIRI